jgi:AcrR family transcriptional regulator
MGPLTELAVDCFILHMANNFGTPGRRSQAESERTRRRILDQAERLFARRGFGGVSIRELASASRVQHRTIQHHFGSKRGLYQAVLGRWDDELEQRLAGVIAGQSDLTSAIDGAVEELFEFLLSKRDWVALTARADTGEELPRGIELRERSWVRFIDSTLQDRKFGPLQLDLGLLLISVEGILNNHLLSRSHYRQLYGRDVTHPRLRRRTKDHLKSVIRALVTA